MLNLQNYLHDSCALGERDVGAWIRGGDTARAWSGVRGLVPASSRTRGMGVARATPLVRTFAHTRASST